MTADRVARPHWSLPWVLAIVGAMSGLVSAIVTVVLFFSSLLFPVLFFLMPALPGLVFGLAVCGTVGRWYSVPPNLDIRFIALSTVAFYLVFVLAAVLLTARKSEPWQDGAICGFVAAGILTSYVRARVTGFGHIFGPVFMVVAGTGLGAILLPLVVDLHAYRIGYLMIGWQGGFAASLGIALALCRVPQK